MASLTCESLSLLDKVAPVKGQVKYTPDTERHVWSLVGTLDPWKDCFFQFLVLRKTDLTLYQL